MKSANSSREEFLAAREPTGPEPISLWKLLRGYRGDPLVRWTRIREQHGPVARYRFGFTDSYFLSSADAVKRVLQENPANYTKAHGTYRMLRRVFGNGLVTSEGEFWLRQRRLAGPAFHRQRVAAMGALMTAAAEETALRWDALASSGEPVQMQREMSRLTLKVVGDALFGAALAERAAAVAGAWDTLSAQLSERHRRRRILPPVLPTRYDREFREARRTLLEIVEQIIQTRRAQAGAGEDLLSMFMNARDEDTGEQMNDGQLRDEVVTMLFAGHETTATALTWAWARLDQHPVAAERLHDELQRVLGGRAPTAEDYSRLEFTRAVFAEALRLDSPAYIVNRHVEEDDVVCGCRVHKGGSIVISPLALQRNPEYWDHPDEFRPERWLDRAAQEKRPRLAYLPFSAGARTCIGNGFAELEGALVLATLAQRFAPRLVEGYRLEPEYLVLARPKAGAPMRIERRSSVTESARVG